MIKLKIKLKDKVYIAEVEILEDNGDKILPSYYNQTTQKSVVPQAQEPTHSQYIPHHNTPKSTQSSTQKN